MTDPFHDIRDEKFQAMIDTQKEGYNSQLESFEVYSARMKSLLHTSFDHYLEKLQHGYDVIIKKIASDIKNPKQ